MGRRKKYHNDEHAFLEAIRADPDNDTPRLVFADWLDEHGQSDRAELIRLQCQFDPIRDRFDDPDINAMRNRIRVLIRPWESEEDAWRRSLHDPLREVRVIWRRGFVDTLELPVQWFIRFGEQFRKRYPMLRKLVIFRLNGWGERLASCEWLRGIREIEFPCWYDVADAQAVAASPYLGTVERVVCWSSEGNHESEMARRFASGSAWPYLKELHLVAKRGDHSEWIRVANETSGRSIGSVYNFSHELFPFAADFTLAHLVGKLPDGSPIFLYAPVQESLAKGIIFDPDGTPRDEDFTYVFPQHLILLPSKPTESPQAEPDPENRVREARIEHLRHEMGFVPAFIRVKRLDLELIEHIWVHTARIRGRVEDQWRDPDDPERGPDEDRHEPLGNGRLVYDWGTEGQFVYDCGSDWWCDQTGYVTST